jgi:NADH:ubiquinone oxidoreductase subunit 6 (subunit J)
MTAVLALIALLTIGTAVAAMSRRSLLYSVLLLTGSWVGVAAFYLWAGAEFAAFAQVLIYVGAISMALLFAVLLTRRSREDFAPGPASRGRALYAILAGAGLAGVLLAAVARGSLAVAPSPVPAVTVRQLGRLLMGPHAASLLVVGVLLTVALIGAVALAAGGGPEKPEDAP